MMPEDDLNLVRWEAVGQASEWEEGRGKRVSIGARRIGVYLWQGEWFALKDICPHAGVALSKGAVCEGAITCTAHGWKFSLESGQCVTGNPKSKVATYPVRIQDGVVEVGV